MNTRDRFWFYFKSLSGLPFVVLIALTIRLNRVMTLLWPMRAVLLVVLLTVLYASTYAKQYCSIHCDDPTPDLLARGRRLTQISQFVSVAAVLILLFL